MGAVAIMVLVAGALALRLMPGTQDEPRITDAPPGTPIAVFAEFGPVADRIYTAPADRPGARVLLDEIEHADGWGINPGPLMADNRFAYTVLPPSATARRDSPAEVWLMDVDTANRTRLARDADLLIPPIFVDDGAALIYRRSSGGQQELVRIDLETSTRRVIHAERTTFGIFPIGYAADGGLVYARLTTEGTQILSVREGRAPTQLFHASDDIAREWRISPDGQRIVFLAPVETMERIQHRTHVAVLSNGAPVDVPGLTTIDGEQYGPLWSPGGNVLAVGRQASPPDAGAITLLDLDGGARGLAGPEEGFDIPMAWSPDGAYLAIRSFDGVDASHPGAESTVIVDLEGGRYPVTADTEIIFIGWWRGA